MDADNKKPVDTDAESAAKGINWLTIFGWAVLAILVVIIFGVLWVYKGWQGNPLMQDAAKMEPYIEEMKVKTRSQIENESQYVYAGEMEGLDDPIYGYFPYTDAYVLVEGEITKEMTENVAANVAGNVMTTDENYGAYVLNNNIVVIDIEKGYQELAEGTTISACGRILIVRLEDIWDLPIIGADLQQEFDGLKDMPEGVVFLISKQIKVLPDGPSGGILGGNIPAIVPDVSESADEGDEDSDLLGPDPEDDDDGEEHEADDDDGEEHEADDDDGEEHEGDDDDE